MAEEEKTIKSKLARGIVARGHTIEVPHPTKTRVVGANPETGKAILGPVVISHGPGSEVTMSEEDIRLYRSLGYLVDPEKAVENAPAEGSHYQEVTS